MELRARKWLYKIPPYSEILSVTLHSRDKHIHFAILHVKHRELIEARNKAKGVLGRPVYFSMYGNVMMLYPTPNEKGTMTIRYAPPIAEF